MKYLHLLLFVCTLVPLSSQAQWKIIALKPNSKVYLGNQLIKKGQEIKHTDKIRFTKADQYIRIHEAGKLPFTLKPGAGKKSPNNELEAQAFAFRVIKKRPLVVRGIQPEQFTPYVIMNPEDTKIWCTGAPIYAPSALSKARKLLFLEKGKLYFSYRLANFDGEVTFFYVYKFNGKRVIKPLLFDNKSDYKLIKFNQNIYNVNGQQVAVDKTSNGGLFIRPKGSKPSALSHFKPYVVAQVPATFKQETSELIKVLDQEMGSSYQAQIAKNLKINPSTQKKVLTQAVALQKFRLIMDFTEVFFDAQPDFNSLKEWLRKNFPKFVLPEEK
ncbi:hypothetical protein BKI52_13565 [marine bacterium AO1-C]|nr:hypothetical protein BKI52_13565 [marine bacterium AO1-C]